MFITRRKYEEALKEAEYRGRTEAEKECYQRFGMREMERRLEALSAEVALLKGPNEGSTGEKDAAPAPLAY